MVFANIREHASSAFIFASRSSNFLMRAASTLGITSGEQRALRKFSASRNLSLSKSSSAPCNGHVQNRTTSAKLLKILRSYRGSTIPNYALLDLPFDAKLHHLASRESAGRR